jgi:hypothetical protein
MTGNAAEKIFDEIQGSSLEDLQFLYAGGKHVDADLIVQAVQSDVTLGLPISEVFFKRFVSSNRDMTKESLEAVLEILRAGLSSPFLRDAEVFKDYANAAVLCMRRVMR